MPEIVILVLGALVTAVTVVAAVLIGFEEEKDLDARFVDQDPRSQGR